MAIGQATGQANPRKDCTMTENTAADQGLIAMKPRHTRAIKLHLMRHPGPDAPTLCGRYTFADALPESTRADYPMCNVCATVAGIAGRTQ